jgi:iron complex transport system substrate-binding protein
MTGRSIMVPESVSRVVALSPSAAEFALALGLEVVGRSNDTAEALAPGAQPVGAAISPDFNAVAALQPDLVLADAAYHSGRTRDFDRFAYPVFILKAATYDGVLEAITAVGDATNAIDRAAEVRTALEARAGSLSDAGNARAAREGKVRVLILTGGGRDIFAGGDSTYLGSLVQLLGAENVLGDAPEGGPISGFGVVEVGTAASLNPDVVLILPSGQGGLLEHLIARTSWADTPAVRESRIHNLDTALFLRSPGPRAGEALESLYQLLWP